MLIMMLLELKNSSTYSKLNDLPIKLATQEMLNYLNTNFEEEMESFDSMAVFVEVLLMLRCCKVLVLTFFCVAAHERNHCTRK